jgi:DNA topoisomerase-1
VGFFKKYVEFDFTASLEEELDHISNGDLSWIKCLEEFWTGFKAAVAETKDLRITEVLDTLDRDLALYLFPPREGVDDPRQCPSCKEGQLSLKLSKFGGFIGCNRYPDCTYTHKLDNSGDDSPSFEVYEPRELGSDPQTGQKISLKKGPYGFYCEWEMLPGQDVVDTTPKLTKSGKPSKAKPKAPKPKRVSLTPGMDPEAVTLQEILDLGQLPKLIGVHPETQSPMMIGIGRFGPYIKHNDKFTSIPKAYDPMTLTLDEAIELLAKAALKPPRVRGFPKKGFGKKKKA